MDELDIGIQALNLEQEIESHPGYLALSKIGAISNMRYIYENNFREFEQHINNLSKGDSVLSLIGEDNKAEEHTLEAARLLHNLLSSIKSLVENERQLLNRWYKSHSFITEHNDKVEEIFINSSLVKFIEEFRNYFLHKSYPQCGFVIEKDRRDFKSSFLLNRDSMLKDWSWSLKSKSFLIEQSERIEILVIIKKYKTLTASFYQWLEVKIRDIHKIEISEVKKLEQSLHAKYRELGHDI